MTHSFRPVSQRQQQGAEGEALALAHLMKQGLVLIGQNLASPLGEIDLLMQDRDQWVFIEVRERRSSAYGGAAASVTPAKQAKLRRQAYKLLQERFGQQSWPAFRFDVFAIEAGTINWIKNAF